MTIFSMVAAPLSGYSALKKELTGDDIVQFSGDMANTQVESLQGRKVLAVLKYRGDGKSCAVNPARNPGVIPSFLESSHLSEGIDEAISQYPPCNSNEVAEIEYMAENFVEGPVQVALAPLAVIGAQFGIGCVGGAIAGGIISSLAQYMEFIMDAGVAREAGVARDVGLAGGSIVTTAISTFNTGAVLSGAAGGFGFYVCGQVSYFVIEMFFE